jgi:hypothetical protein
MTLRAMSIMALSGQGAVCSSNSQLRCYFKITAKGIGKLNLSWCAALSLG